MEKIKTPKIVITDYRDAYRFRKEFRDHPKHKERLKRVSNKSLQYTIDFFIIKKAQMN